MLGLLLVSGSLLHSAQLCKFRELPSVHCRSATRRRPPFDLGRQPVAVSLQVPIACQPELDRPWP